MGIISLLLYLYLLLKPYYLFSSGGLQISDIFLLLSFFVFIIACKNKKSVILNELSKNKHYIIFAVFAVIINGIYYLIYSDPNFILSSSYFVFNLFAIILFSYKFSDAQFIYKMNKIFKFNIILQVIIYFAGIGRYYSVERYMGTFNDPNQFAYYILLSLAFIYICSAKQAQPQQKFNKALYFILSAFLIFLSGSTGMLLGLIAMILLELLLFFRNIGKTFKKFVILSLIIIPVFFGIVLTKKVNLSSFSSIPIIERVNEKINKFNNNNNKSNYSSMTVWQERGYDKLYIYPKYLIYGSGEGMYNRFSKSAHMIEIHATFPSIWFYYGIIPLLILLVWFYKKIKGLPLNLKIIYYALLIESFTLLNQRQALFWVVFILGSFIIKKDDCLLFNNNEKKKSLN